MATTVGETPCQIIAQPSQRICLSRRVAHLDVAVYCGDTREKIVGQTRRRLNVALTEERFGQITKQGLAYSVRILLVAPPRYLKIVIYNYETDLVGSMIVTMK